MFVNAGMTIGGAPAAATTTALANHFGFLSNPTLSTVVTAITLVLFAIVVASLLAGLSFLASRARPDVMRYLKITEM